LRRRAIQTTESRCERMSTQMIFSSQLISGQLGMRFAQLRVIGWFVTSVPSESADHRFSTTSWTPVMGVWTAQSQCEMNQAAFVWPQRWSNTVSDQTRPLVKEFLNYRITNKCHATYGSCNS
jgi:hypothetical protein